MSIWSHIKKFDWILFGSMIALVIFGLVSIWSSSSSQFTSSDYGNIYKQLLFFAVSLLAMVGVSFIDNRTIRENPALMMVFYFLCIILLVGVFFFTPEIKGIRSWYKIGFISFDPIEPTKLILVLILAKYFSKRHIELYSLKHIFFSGLYVALPAILIFLHPELGSVAILLMIWISILFISGIRLRHFLLLVLAFIVTVAIGWNVALKDYQKNRLISFIAPQEDPLGKGWNQNQSKISIGSGGLFGTGVGKGTQTQYGFLPEPHTDFIFSAIAEEMGFLGVFLLLGFFMLLYYRILKIALNAKSNFCRLFASGIAVSIFSQMFINIGMNLGILPVIGIPLPLVSYGGSNLLFNFIALGILQNMSITEA
ncbi:MAG: rod shape-determining protein RodA [Candidatus Pacebacteria bacterium]|nr:rod shape-determining protein RodA [Candidatus Paceibacterota bacterium]